VVNPVVMSVNPSDNRLPIPSATIGSNGLPIESNGKHTPGLPGYNPNAGTEPRNSLELFNSSVPSTKDGDTTRYTISPSGDIDRFFEDGNGTYHWSGSTRDSKAPLDPQKIPIGIRRLAGK
jgi:filamentous hemagglutinin